VLINYDCQDIYAPIISKDKDIDNAFTKEIIEIVRQVIGPIAKPDKIQFCTSLPKSRTGKFKHRILRKIASHDLLNLGDTSTRLYPDVVEQ